MTTLLKFGLGNAKIGKHIHTIHGTQPKDSLAAKSVRALDGLGSYGKGGAK